MNSYFAGMLEYERWANQRILDYLDETGDHKKIRKIFSHLLADMQPWIFLMKGKAVPDIIDCNPDWSVDECKASAMTIYGSLKTILHTSSQTMDDIIESPGSNGKLFKNTRKEIFTHLLSHSQHHRGQIEYIIETETSSYYSTSYLPYLRMR